MNKKYFLGMLIFALLIVGSACTKNDDNEALNNGTNSQNGEMAENVDEGQIDRSDWLTYTNEEYGFEMMYPEKYKTVVDDYGWPNSIVHFIEKSDSAQAYRATVSVWDNLDDYRDSTVYSAMRYHSHNSTDGKKIVKSFIAIGSETELIEEWEAIIDTFEVFEPTKEASASSCTKPEDLINKYGCHPGMTCDDGKVCREGLCVEAADAPNEYGCNPLMMCDKGQECRKGVCVNAIDAPDPFGCHPTAKCGEGEVCRSGLCIKVCEE